MKKEMVLMATLPVNELNRLVAIEEGLEELISDSDGLSISVWDLRDLLKGD